MPSLLLHLSVLETLSQRPELPPRVAVALREDLPYARFGAAFPALGPGLLRACLGGGTRRGEGFSTRLHAGTPVALGLKLAELVAMGALVGAEPGLALVTGYFSHLCLDRALADEEAALARVHRRPGETLEEARRRIAWQQALFYLREHEGVERVGHPAVRATFQLTKGGALRGVGGGIFEVVRLASREVLGETLQRSEVDAWLREVALAGWLLSGPLGRLRRLPAASTLSARELYRGPEVDVPARVEEALAQVCRVMDRLAGLMERQRFTLRARERFLAEFPEGGPPACIV
jgi:hypothetical protein